MNNINRILICFLMVVSGFVYGADNDQSQVPSKEEVFRKPKDNEPVFPLEDMIGKPLKNNDKLFSDLMNMMATLGMVLGLILIVAWFLKKLTTTRIEKMNENSMVKILERRNLSPKSLLYILEIEGRRIIVAESPQGVTRIADYRSEKL